MLMHPLLGALPRACAYMFSERHCGAPLQLVTYTIVHVVERQALRCSSATVDMHMYLSERHCVASLQLLACTCAHVFEQQALRCFSAIVSIHVCSM